MTKPTFDPEYILDWLSAYVAADEEANRTGKTVKVKGFPFRVCPDKDRKPEE